MRIDDPSHLLPHAARERARQAGDAAVGGEAWMLEIERARQDAWICDATAPGEAASAVAWADELSTTISESTGRGSTPTSLTPVGESTRASPVPLRPYGMAVETAPDELAAAVQSPGAASVGAAAGRVATAALSSASSLIREAHVDAAAPPRFGAASESTRGVLVPAASAAAAAWDHLSATSREAMNDVDTARTPRTVAPQALMSAPVRQPGVVGAEPVPVRVHVERAADGRLSAWLGVDHGADRVAAVIVSALRADARRRGDTLGAVVVNGLALEADADARADVDGDAHLDAGALGDVRSASSSPSRPPADGLTPSNRQTLTGEH